MLEKSPLEKERVEKLKNPKDLKINPCPNIEDKESDN